MRDRPLWFGRRDPPGEQEEALIRLLLQGRKIPPALQDLRGLALQKEEDSL